MCHREYRTLGPDMSVFTWHLSFPCSDIMANRQLRWSRPLRAVVTVRFPPPDAYTCLRKDQVGEKPGVRGGLHAHLTAFVCQHAESEHGAKVAVMELVSKEAGRKHHGDARPALESIRKHRWQSSSIGATEIHDHYQNHANVKPLIITIRLSRCIFPCHVGLLRSLHMV